MPYPAIAIDDVGNSGGIDRESFLVPRSIDMVPDPLSISLANRWWGPHETTRDAPGIHRVGVRDRVGLSLRCLSLSTIIRPARHQ